MSENFEDELRRALRPVDAPTGFTERVMRALPARREPAPVVVQDAPPHRMMKRFGIPMAFAAALVLSVVLGRQVRDAHDVRVAAAEREAGLAASRELMQALQVTSKKLDLAYQAVKAPPPPAGDEENRT
jgi:hypothetical protein